MHFLKTELCDKYSVFLMFAQREKMYKLVDEFVSQHIADSLGS